MLVACRMALLRCARVPDRPRTSVTADVPVASTGLLVGEREHRLYLLRPEDVDYIESHGNYVNFHVANKVYIRRDTIKRLSSVLSGTFVRIERSFLVNLQAIAYAQRVGRGTFAFTLRSGPSLRSGYKYRKEILRVLPLGQRFRLSGDD